MLSKVIIYNECIQQLDEKIAFLQAALNDLSEGAENDAKSSAGDKHETSRAMMQLEQEKVSRQLGEVRSQKSTLEHIDPTMHSPVVATGSLLKTNRGYLFISAALGKVTVDGETVINLSINSPLGQKLAGLEAGGKTELNGIEYRIEEVL